MLTACYKTHGNDGTAVRLLEGMAQVRMARNREYLMRLTYENLVLPFEMEAGLVNVFYKRTDFHWGWDSPLSHLRGTFTGHWLSAAARMLGVKDDPELKLKADRIVDRIAFCQKENGNGWAFPIPEKYLYWLKRGKKTWAPQYVCHKVMMGLLEMYRYTGNKTALEVLKGCAAWFTAFTKDISREQMDAIMDFEETGGMLELWSDLYAITGEESHRQLIRAYERPHLFEPLLEGVDVLTNMHANTTIPEIYGAARAYEVTGEERYRRIVENYWELAVTKRGTFATGGQTSGEIWTPMKQQSARLGDKNQELCSVYNMMRLSQYLYRWTGEARFADYWEQNLYNGIYAQSYWEEEFSWLHNEDNPPKKGHVLYYLPMEAGAHKPWGNETEHFWCCNCTMVQANASFAEAIYYQDGRDIIVAQYLPSVLTTQVDAAPFTLTQTLDLQADMGLFPAPVNRTILSRPDSVVMHFEVDGNGQSFALKFRKPWWLKGDMSIRVDGEPVAVVSEGGYLCVTRSWHRETIDVCMPLGLTAWPLPDRTDTVAFLYGPITLAGLIARQPTLIGDKERPETLLIPTNERRWCTWQPNFRTVNQPLNIAFIPLFDVGYEAYTLYFQIKGGDGYESTADKAGKEPLC